MTSRRDEILDHAASLFYDLGAHAVGMRAIAERAGISTGTLYHHFTSRSEILFRIAQGVTTEFIDDHIGLIEKGTDVSQLQELIRRHIVFFWDRRHWNSVVLRELRGLDVEHFEEVRKHRRRYQLGIQAFIQRGVNAGLLDVPNVRVAGLALLDMINGINTWFRLDGPLSIEEIADMYSDMVLFGLLGARRSTGET